MFFESNVLFTNYTYDKNRTQATRGLTHLSRVLLEQVRLAELMVGHWLVLDVLRLEGVVQRAYSFVQSILRRRWCRGKGRRGGRS